MLGVAENKACDGVRDRKYSVVGFLPSSTASLVIWLQPHSQKGNNICLRQLLWGLNNTALLYLRGLTPVPKMSLLQMQKSLGRNGNAVVICVPQVIRASLKPSLDCLYFTARERLSQQLLDALVSGIRRMERVCMCSMQMRYFSRFQFSVGWSLGCGTHEARGLTE